MVDAPLTFRVYLAGPLFSEAERAYLGAYEERSGQRLDPRRLAWHRASAELHRLAVLFAKDRIRLADVPRVRALVDSFVAAAR